LEELKDKFDMTESKNLIVILNPDYDPQIEREMFSKAGYEFVSAQCTTDEETIAAAKDALGIINIYCKISENVAKNLKRCKVIVRAGVGYDMIDAKACRAHGIEVCNMPDYCTEEVADHAVSLLLMLQRKLIQHHHFVQKGIWDGAQVGEVRRLNTLTLGIIGFGAIGRRFASKMREITPHIIAYDPYVPEEYFQRAGVQKAALEEVCLGSDLISLHCPLTKENYHIISDEIIHKMTRKPIIVNVSRGALIDEPALIEGLKSGLIGAAGLDVVENEPKVPPELLTMENVVITPHIAWYSVEAEIEDRTRSVEEVLRVIRGEPPQNPVP
jgi:D-3-phosphoglycerate dehydrogenase